MWLEPGIMIFNPDTLALKSLLYLETLGVKLHLNPLFLLYTDQ
jgi:hypothetical protein